MKKIIDPDTKLLKYELDALSNAAYEMCLKRKWDRGWSAGGCYLHLEASEFIEALRGKHGDVEREAGDVLIVLLSILRANNISLNKVFDKAWNTITGLSIDEDSLGE